MKRQFIVLLVVLCLGFVWCDGLCAETSLRASEREKLETELSMLFTNMIDIDENMGQMARVLGDPNLMVIACARQLNITIASLMRNIEIFIIMEPAIEDSWKPSYLAKFREERKLILPELVASIDKINTYMTIAKNQNLLVCLGNMKDVIWRCKIIIEFLEEKI